MKQESDELVFLVRMWARETERPTEQEWRGSIQEINSGLRFYVTETRDVADFIAARLAASVERTR